MKKIFSVIAALLFMGGQLNCKQASQKQTKPKYTLTITSFFRNDARFLKEWIEYHRMMGVEHFLLFDHLSEDDYMPILKPYIDEGIVDLTILKVEPPTYPKWKLFHRHYLNEAIKKARGLTQWLAIVDTDEFIVVKKHKTIQDFLKEYKDYGGVMLNWQLFGPSNIWEIPSNKLMITTLLHQQKTEDLPPNLQCKSIVQPTRAIRLNDSTHQCRYKAPYYGVDTNKIPSRFACRNNCGTRKCLVTDACIHHYRTRDRRFLKEQRATRFHTPNFSEATLKKMSAVYNPFMLRYEKEMQRRIKEEP